MKRIAIIDDDFDITESIEAVLKSHGYETFVAHNIFEGEKIVTEQNPDLVILDVMMEEPDDGFFLARKLRKGGFNKPILMLSSVAKAIGFDYNSNEIAPVNEFLEKPISPKKLIEKIQEFLPVGGSNASN